MPWKDSSIVSLRTDFVRLANEPGSDLSALARRFGISRTSACRWLTRYRAEGTAGLADRPLTPRSCPGRTSEILPAVIYDDGLVRSVQVDGHFSFGAVSCHLSNAFAGEIIALKETGSDGCHDAIYCGFRVASLDLRDPTRTENRVPGP